MVRLAVVDAVVLPFLLVEFDETIGQIAAVADLVVLLVRCDRPVENLFRAVKSASSDSYSKSNTDPASVAFSGVSATTTASLICDAAQFSKFGSMGSVAARVIEIYQRHALAWSRDRGDRLLERGWLDRFVALLPPQRRTVLDIGCGNGVPIARYLVGRGCQVTGVDSSSAMIAMCADRFPQCHWHVADMRTLSLDRTFGGIVAWNSFFHLSATDQRRMFPIFKQHAAPGAVLMFTSGPSAGEQIGCYQGEPLYHASLDGAEYRALLGGNGFDVVTNVVEDPTCGLLTVWLARLCITC